MPLLLWSAALLTLLAGARVPSAPPAVMPPAVVAAPQQDRDPNTCAAHAEWLGETELVVRRDAVVPLTLFTATGPGVWSTCSLSIPLSAAFFDRGGAVVCSGLVEIRLLHAGPVTYTHLEIQPGNIYEFVRWINGPRAISQQWSRLSCMSADGQTEAQAADFGRMQSVRMHAVLPGNTQVAVAEVRLVLSQ